MEKIKGDTMIFRLFEQYGRNIGSIDIAGTEKFLL